jgi:hypothetical protein
MNALHEIAKAELIKSAKLGQAVFEKVCDESDSVGHGVMGLAFALTMASVASPKPVPLDQLHELLDLVHKLVADADESAYEGAEKYGIQ